MGARFSLLMIFAAVLLIVGGLPGPAPAVEDGPGSQDLLAYWSFNEGDGPEASDVTGNGFDGTVERAVWTAAGVCGSAMQFFGTGQHFEELDEATYVDTPFKFSNAGDTTEYTVSAWFRGSSTFSQNVMGYYNGTDMVVHLLHSPAANDVHFNMRDPSVNRNTIEVTTGDNLADNEWHHIAFRRQATSEVDIFVDGALQPKTVLYDNVLSDHTQASNWFIGASHDTYHGKAQQVFNGTVDEVKIYGQALTDAEIAAEFHDPCGDPPLADTGGPYLAPVDGTVDFDGSGSIDPEGATLTYEWTVSQGTLNDPGLEMPSYTAPAEPGINDVTITVIDPSGLSATASTYVVVYDPEGGFVTGGGWFTSEAGSFTPDPSLTGKATFGFVSKYKKGADAPTGNTQFHFQVAELNFHSESYDWLVVTGSDYARYKGTGTINGTGDYRFMIWAGDSDPDTFRIKVWTEDDTGSETIYYDNGFDQALQGGSILIHRK